MTTRKALVGDIGGTNARFAIADLDTLSVDRVLVHPCRDFASLEDALVAYLATLPELPARACLAVAAPLRSETIRMTNLDWTFTTDSLRIASGIDDLRLINDFEAQARALPHLRPDDLHRIGGGRPVERQPKVVLGPGTGLGMAGLVHGGESWIPIASEGGHVSFAAETDEELAIVGRMAAEFGRVSTERLVSGPGVEKTYAILARLRGAERQGIPVADIFELASGEHDPFAVDTARYFVKWLGRFAGDMALAYGAAGGVYVAGGIAPRILDLLETGVFRQSFCDKGRMSGFLENVPLQVVTAGDAGLRGAAAAL
jgi:glucokinase